MPANGDILHEHLNGDILSWPGLTDTSKRREYFAAVRAGLDREYEPMAKLFTAVIERALQIHGKQ